MKSMIQKTLSAAAVALAFGFGFATTGWADTSKTNPVTGETETYVNTFTGEATEWNSAANWDTSTTPFITTTYSPALVDGKTVSTSSAIDGWTLRVGAYNHASVTWSGGITKIQAGSVGCWLTAADTSKITIASFAGNQLEGSDSAPFKLTSANAGGITWQTGLTSASNTSLPFWYYLKGTGTVVYGGDITVANAQVIKMADAALSGTSQVASKTLVTFGSGTTKAFTADATIKVRNSSDDVVKTVKLSSVNSTGTTTLTTSNPVGTCELVQTSTGIVLFWVDGDPSSVATYKRSINVNFTNGNGLSTGDDVGLSGYAVPGTSWNNFEIPNDANDRTFNTVNAIDATGASYVASGVSVKVSNHRGRHQCSSLDSASNLLHGYIDEGAEKTTPTVTITGIPYEHYRVIVYHSTDTASLPFGYDTINGFNFTYDENKVQKTGTDSWGNAGGSNSAEPIAEGTNTLVSDVLSGDTVTMVAHRVGGATPTARGCFAAIQVVEYVPEVGENDLEIPVNGATTYNVDTAKTLSGTVYLTGSGTLTLTGSEKITAATIDVAKDVVLNINADRLDATTFTGAGTVVYDTTAPVEGKGWASIGWSGTVWIKNQSVSSFESAKFGNAGSTVRFTGVTGFLQTSSWNGSTYVHTVPLELVDEGNTVAFTYNNGWGGNLVKVNTLKGTGTLKTQGSGAGEHIYIVDASGFTGVFNLTAKSIYVGGDQPAYSDSTGQSGKLEIRSGMTMTVPSGKTWTANGGFVVNGTLNVDGTLASSHTTKAVSGSGTVVFTGRAPTVSGDAWWKNADWTGTVQVKDVTNMVGDSRTGVWLKFNDYGNSGSVVEMNNVTGWLETGYTCTPKIKITGTLYLNNGGSGKASAFKVGTLLGSGTISGDGSAGTVVFNVTDDWSGFTGTIGLNNKCIVFGSTIPDDLTAGTIYVSEGAVVTPQQSSGVWWGVGGIKVDGELRAPNLDKFGGGTTITTSDNGVFTLLTSSQIDDQSTSYARITGTGTLRYADGGGNNWRTLSQTDFPTGMICENNISAGLILKTAGGNHTIGSLAGSGKVRSDWGNGNRNLKVLQSRDTVYSGLFDAGTDRVGTFTVAPGATTAGTLTLSGTQTASNDLMVDSGAKVKITGKWVGATTVAGSLAFGDANGAKIAGAVTTSSGAVLDFSDFTVGETAPISGALTLDANTTIKFPAGVQFPYKLAGSFGGSVTSLAADKYTIGGVAGTVPLMLANGSAYTEARGTISGNCDWASITWENGATPVSGSEVSVSVTADATLSLGVAPVIAMKATFNVPANTTLMLSGSLITGEINFTGAGKVVCSARNTLAGVIKGDATVTVEYPEHTLPAVGLGAADWTSNDWKGTLVLKNCGREQNVNYYPAGETHDVVRFDQYGSANSVIRAPGYKGISAVANQNTTCPATLFIDAGETVEFNHGTGESALNTNGAGFRFAKLAGTGTLRLDGTSDTAQYIFNNVAEFAGTVEITFPAEGGRKSFLFGAADNWEVMNSAYAANLVILDNMAVAAGKTWDIPAGIIIGAGKTLTLASGATVKALSKDTEGTIAVPSGTATLQGVSNAVVNAAITIGENATLNITDPSLTTLTIPADSSAGGTYGNAGTLDLRGCTSLTTLHLALGEAKTFDLSKVTLPQTCTTVYCDIGDARDLTGYSLPASSGTVAYYATETMEEYANGGFAVSNVSAGAVWLIRQNGALIKTAESGTDRTYEGGRSFAGAACWHEWDFEQEALADRLKDTGRFSTNEVDYANLVTLAVTGTDSDANYSTCLVEVQSENKRVLSSAVYPNAEIAFGTTWSAALRCSMPTVTGDGKVVAIAFGDATSGVLGLAAGADGFMELFTWEGGTYTVLAQLKVESPSNKDNMHLYVFAVNNGTVTFYRDGEFIHTAAFTLGSLTRFMVGDVADRGDAQNLPSAVGSGGYVDYVRLYDKVLPVADVEGLSVRRPFVSAIDAYERTASQFQNWSATDAWTWKKGNNGGTVAADAPANDANVTLVADGQTDISLNLASDAGYNTLIFGGNGAVGLNQTSTGTIGAQMMVVRSGVNLTVDYDAVSLTSAVVGVDEGASLAFDFSAYPFDAVTAVTNITLVGTVPAVLYDNTCAARYSVVLPDTLPAYITSAVASWDGATYKITITPNHTAGGTVYYKDGGLAAGMTVYTDAELTVETKLFAGDTLVISAASATGDISVGDTFDGDISVTRAAVSLTSTGTGALAGRTVTVESGKALNFAGGSFGAVTLAGDGAFAFTDDTTAASLSGTVGITVADGKTLTLTAAMPFVSGGVSGSGTVKLPAVTESVDFNVYGNANSTVELAGVTDGALTSGGTCNPALLLDGAATFATLGSYTFTAVSGSGNLSFPADSAVTIADLKDYTGTVANGSATAVTVTKLTKTGVFVGGDVLLTKDGSGAVNVSSVEVGGVAKQGVWDGNNYRLAVAQYNGQNYATIEAAVTAAGENFADITVLDETAEVPAGYYVDDGHLARIIAAVVSATGSPVYYGSVQDAVDAVSGVGAGYEYIAAYVGATVTAVETVRIKPMNAAEVSVYPASDEFAVSASEPAEGVTTYTVTSVPGRYTWNGQVTSKAWAAPEAWLYGTGSAARRCPGVGDDVVFASEATVGVSGDLAVKSISVSGAVTINNSGVDGVTLSAASGGIVLTAAGGRITVSGVTLSPAPTTTVEGASVIYTQATSTYALWVPSNVTLTPATPVFQDYTNATIVATVTADDTFDAEHATYTATVGGQSYTGTYASGVVTFEIPGSAGDSANVTLTATPQAGGAAVATVSTSFVFGTASDWFAETATTFGNSGTWANATADTTEGKIVLSGDANATFTPTMTMTGNTADVVWVVSFDAPNDDDLSEELVGAQTAFRLATGGFQLWVTNGSSGAWVNVAATGITPAINTEYTVTNHFDYSAHTLTVTVNGQPLTADNGTTTTFALPSGKTKVDSFEFAGAGALTGIAGNFINTMLYVDGDGTAYATLAEALASGNPVTALDPDVILTVEPGLELTVPTGMPAANIKPTYNGASISGYVDVSIVNGKVTLSATDAAAPSATAMTAEGIAVGNVKPGLFYWVEASTTQDFATKTNGTPVQATSEEAVTVAPTNPTGKVIFYRVAVDAEKPQ